MGGGGQEYEGGVVLGGGAKGVCVGCVCGLGTGWMYPCSCERAYSPGAKTTYYVSLHIRCVHNYIECMNDKKKSTSRHTQIPPLFYPKRKTPPPIALTNTIHLFTHVKKKKKKKSKLETHASSSTQWKHIQCGIHTAIDKENIISIKFHPRERTYKGKIPRHLRIKRVGIYG